MSGKSASPQETVQAVLDLAIHGGPPLTKAQKAEQLTIPVDQFERILAKLTATGIPGRAHFADEQIEPNRDA